MSQGRLTGLDLNREHWGKAAEKDYQQTVTELLTTFRWEWNHTYRLRTEHGWRTGTTAKGWPDIVALRAEHIVAIEVKGYDARGRPTPFQPGQIGWLERFAGLACGRAWVLRPTDPFEATVRWLRFPADAPVRFGYDPPAGPPRAL